MNAYIKKREALYLDCKFENLKFATKNLKDQTYKDCFKDFEESFHFIMNRFLPKIKFNVPEDINMDGIKSYTELQK